MEVTTTNETIKVRITGPYFYNYVHKLKGGEKAPPGDLYISSKGWTVSGKPPYTNDVFEESEGWDYVVSFEKKGCLTFRSDDNNPSWRSAPASWDGGNQGVLLFPPLPHEITKVLREIRFSFLQAATRGPFDYLAHNYSYIGSSAERVKVVLKSDNRGKSRRTR